MKNNIEMIADKQDDIYVTKKHLEAMTIISDNEIYIWSLPIDYVDELLELMKYGLVFINEHKLFRSKDCPPLSDNMSNHYCPTCRTMGLIHCSEVEYCSSMIPMSGKFIL